MDKTERNCYNCNHKIVCMIFLNIYQVAHSIDKKRKAIADDELLFREIAKACNLFQLRE